MPLYNYECDSCNRRFDAQRKIADRATCNCPSCDDGIGFLKIQPVNFAYLKMGLDPQGNPTAADKWARMHEQKGSKKHLGITE
jgi:putative FmdB family regulatory protein